MGTQEEPIEEQVQEEQQELEPEDTETLLQRVQEAEARAARMEAEFQRQRDEDFRRKLESAPPEERMQLELEFERSKRQEAEMRLVRNEIRQEYPLFTGMLEIFGQHFQMEFDSAEELRAIAQAMGPELSRLFSDSITTEKGKVRKEAVKKWGIQGSTGNVAGVPESKSASQIRYDAIKAKFEQNPNDPVLLQQMIKARGELTGR